MREDSLLVARNTGLVISIWLRGKGYGTTREEL